ncbi:MAG TPA: helix-turn-helix domain-containing protein, partial [Ktedonosporobacter sp.]|nr:helix-turn-helix domain-containing protein [Ktedonosporobacter sp.]
FSKRIRVHPSTVRGWIKKQALKVVILPSRRSVKRQQCRIKQQTWFQLIGSTNPSEELFTPQQAARFLHVGTPQIRRWLNSGGMDAILLPQTGQRRHYRIKRSTLENLGHAVGECKGGRSEEGNDIYA